MKFQERLELFPPVLCRLLAREKNRPLTDQEISTRGGWAEWRNGIDVAKISQERSWDDVTVDNALMFMRGCGVDLTDGRAMVRHDDYLKKNPTFNYLRKHKEWNSYYLPLLVTWRKSYPLDPPANLWPPIRNLLVRLTPIMKQAP